MALFLERRIGRTPYKTGGFLSSMLLTCETEPQVHGSHLGPRPRLPVGHGGEEGTDVNIKLMLLVVPWVINYLDAFGFIGLVYQSITFPLYDHLTLGGRVGGSSLLCLLLKWLNYFHRFSMCILLTVMACLFSSGNLPSIVVSAFFFLSWFAHGLFWAGSSFYCSLLISASKWEKWLAEPTCLQLDRDFQARSVPRPVNVQWLPLRLVQMIYLLSPSLTAALPYFALYCPWGWKSANAFPNRPYHLVS